jgi:hypothetical protein
VTAPRFALLAALALGCIDRPPRDAQMAQQRASVDRNALRGVLVSELPKDAVGVGATFGNSIELVAWRVEPAPLVPGQHARLTLYWRCRADVGEAWHIFLHLDDATGTGVRINRDHDPAGGRYPTDAWRPGEIIEDPVVFPVDRNPLMMYVGFFSTGEARLPITNPGRGRNDGANRLLAGILPVAIPGQQPSGRRD